MFRLIFFRASSAELKEIGWRHFAIGLLCTWLVGMGRYWDNPRVGLLQHLGIGSIVYIFVLSLFLWLIIWPLRPKNWTYFKVLTFISLVSPPAGLYAIPVEKFAALELANTINAWLLAIVATWRVALLIFYLRRVGQLKRFPTFVATFLPLTAIVVALAMLNLEKVVFNFMGGIRDASPNDSAFEVLFLLSLLSVMLFIPLLICYLWLLVDRFTTARYRVNENE
jgi:hypothetical protein